MRRDFWPMASMGVLGTVCLGLFFGSLVGYVLNIVAWFHMLDGPASALFFARIVGAVIPPIGVILGLFF